MSKIKLELYMVIEGIEEMIPLVVEYTYHKAWSGGGISPDEAAHCEPRYDLEMIDVAEAIDRLIGSGEFQAILMRDAFEDRCAAEEYRADAARDERMTRDWEGQ